MYTLLLIILIVNLIFGIFLFIKYRELQKQNEKIMSSVNDDITIWNEFNEVHKKD